MTTDQLRQAAQTVVDRWDSPNWGGSAENLKHTGEYIAALRAALAQQDAQAVPLTEKQRVYLAQAWAMLEDYAADQRQAGNDSIADGADASAHEIKLMLNAAPTPPAQPTQAATDVLAERRRQIEAEGWTSSHDDEYLQSGSLAAAAACYALSAAGLKNAAPSGWPWSIAWWKPTTPRRDLVKAGALILAEIERLDRQAATQGGQT